MPASKVWLFKMVSQVGATGVSVVVELDELVLAEFVMEAPVAEVVVDADSVVPVLVAVEVVFLVEVVPVILAIVSTGDVSSSPSPPPLHAPSPRLRRMVIEILGKILILLKTIG